MKLCLSALVALLGLFPSIFFHFPVHVPIFSDYCLLLSVNLLVDVLWFGKQMIQATIIVSKERVRASLTSNASFLLSVYFSTMFQVYEEAK